MTETWQERRKKIAAMLEVDMSYTEIAAEFGISKQRIGQLSNKLGLSGRTKATFNRSTIKWNRKINELPSIASLASASGLKIDALTWEGRLKKKLIAMNGRSCFIGHLSVRPSLGMSIVGIYPPKTICEFALLKCPLDDSWFVFPRRSLPRKPSCFSIDPSWEMPVDGFRHDWLEFRNAWHLLKMSEGE